MMKKILTILLFVLAAQAFSQVDNRFRYNWIYSQEFSGGIVLPNLSNGTDTIFLVLNGATGEIDSIGITELKSIFGSGGGGSGDISFTDTNSIIATKYDLDTLTVSNSGVSRAELGDSTTAVRSDLTEQVLLRLEISDTTGMLNTYSRLEDLGDTAAVLRSLINSGGGGGSGGLNDTIIIGGNDTTVENTSAGTLYISLAEDVLYLAPSLSMDSLAEFYIENHRGGDLTIIAGLTNSLNDGTNTTLTVPVRGGVFIRCLGNIGGVIRFSAIGNYTE